MSIDPAGFPLGGSVALTAGAYAVFSLFISGDIISERVIENSGWPEQCERLLVRSVKNNPPMLQSVPPKVDCKGIFNILTGQYSSGSDAICNLVDSVIEASPAGQIEAQNRRAVEAYKSRIANAAKNAGSACKCASTLVQSERVPWGIYAGSWRIIKPAELGNLNAKLSAALISPLCTGMNR